MPALIKILAALTKVNQKDGMKRASRRFKSGSYNSGVGDGVDNVGTGGASTSGTMAAAGRVVAQFTCTRKGIGLGLLLLAPPLRSAQAVTFEVVDDLWVNGNVGVGLSSLRGLC